MKLAVIAFFICLPVFPWRKLVSAQAKEKSCRSVIGDLTKMQLNLISKCSKVMKFKNGKDKSKKMNCILHCAMMEVGVLDGEGMLLVSQKVAFLEKFFPESIRERADTLVTPCVDISLKDKFKTLAEDEFCTSYDAFFKCMLGALPRLCD